MMYQTGLVAVIKVNGKVLREDKDAVLLPFGSEYSILIKNLKSRRVMVKVTVDGTDATDGTLLVIHANSEIELQRFIKNGNLSQGNRFKFIQRTEEIEEFRGIKADDGLIRIEYWTESDPPLVIPRPYINYGPDNIRYNHDVQIWNTALKGSVDSPRYRSFDSIDSGGERSRGISSRGISTSSVFLNSVNSTPTASFSAQSDEGITVPGSLSNQQFTTVSSFPVQAQSEVLILKLRGTFANKPVPKPITVKTRQTCTTCGKRSDSTSRFCPVCGTSLQIF
jgi:hypothetical protein